jgi:hypothetical protein
MACGAKMMLINVDSDDTMVVLGCEHHAFKCSECHDVKWHLVFIRHCRGDDNTPVLGHGEPLIVPLSTTQSARTGLFRRLAVKIRGFWEAAFGTVARSAAAQQKRA